MLTKQNLEAVVLYGKVVGTEDAERGYARMELGLIEVRAQNASPCKCICSGASLVRPKFRHAEILL
jgi:hypothetical protein